MQGALVQKAGFAGQRSGARALQRTERSSRIPPRLAVHAARGIPPAARCRSASRWNDARAADGNGRRLRRVRQRVDLLQDGGCALCRVHIRARDADALDGHVTLQARIERVLDGGVSAGARFTDDAISVQYELALKHPSLQPFTSRPDTE